MCWLETSQERGLNREFFVLLCLDLFQSSKKLKSYLPWLPIPVRVICWYISAKQTRSEMIMKIVFFCLFIYNSFSLNNQKSNIIKSFIFNSLCFYFYYSNQFNLFHSKNSIPIWMQKNIETFDTELRTDRDRDRVNKNCYSKVFNNSEV